MIIGCKLTSTWQDKQGQLGHKSLKVVHCTAVDQYAQSKRNKPVFSIIRQLSRWHCPHVLTQARRAAIVRYVLPRRALSSKPTTAACEWWTDGRSDGQTCTRPLHRPCYDAASDNNYTCAIKKSLTKLQSYIMMHVGLLVREVRPVL